MNKVEKYVKSKYQKIINEIKKEEYGISKMNMLRILNTLQETSIYTADYNQKSCVIEQIPTLNNNQIIEKDPILYIEPIKNPEILDSVLYHEICHLLSIGEWNRTSSNTVKHISGLQNYTYKLSNSKILREGNDISELSEAFNDWVAEILYEKIENKLYQLYSKNSQKKIKNYINAKVEDRSKAIGQYFNNNIEYLEDLLKNDKLNNLDEINEYFKKDKHMEDVLNISVLNKNNKEDYKQLKVLIKKFLINTYIRNLKEYSHISGKKKKELVSKGEMEYETRTNLSILSLNDINKIEKQYAKHIESLNASINEERKEEIETRYYLLKNKQEVVAFQECHITKNKEGWRNLAFIKPEYAGKSGKVINTKGKMIEGLYSEKIYQDITQWFEEKEIKTEKTSTGVNMFSNIQAYIILKGFLPYVKNDTNIYFKKDKNSNMDKSALKQVYNTYYNNYQRIEPKNRQILMQELDSIPELSCLNKTQKNSLINCCLNENELKKEMINNRTKELNSYIEKEINNKDNNIDYPIIQNIAMELIKNIHIIDRQTSSEDEFINNRKKKIILSYDNAVEIYTKIKLMELKENNKTITQDNIELLQNKYHINKQQIEYIIYKILRNGKRLEENIKELMSDLAYSYYNKKNDQNIEEEYSISNITKFVNKDIVNNLINEYNKELKEIETHKEAKQVERE